LKRGTQLPLKPLYVFTGDEDFLKRQALTVLIEMVLGKGSDTFGLSTHAGDNASFADVRDEVDTLPFLSQRRLVVVENADPFVTRWRPQLERYVGTPSANGVLALVVKTWPSNTKLAKLVDAGSTIDCKALPPYRLPDWCALWSKSAYGKELAQSAARLLVDLIGAEMGQLDQELQKLASYVGAAGQIAARDVDRLVGSSRTESVFKIFDAIGGAQPAEALKILDDLLDQGEAPIRLLGAFSMQLRRLASAALAHKQGKPLAAALGAAGVPPFAQRGCEQQLRHLGPRRAALLYDWLIEVDLGLKGGSTLPERTLLERLVARMALPV
jgi:DNA polymerase-3 subunit delta